MYLSLPIITPLLLISSISLHPFIPYPASTLISLSLIPLLILIPCFCSSPLEFLHHLFLSHLSLGSQFLIHYILISLLSLSSLSIISSSLPRFSVPYPLFLHLSLVSQFLIHCFFISPSTLNFSSLTVLSHTLLCSFPSSLYFPPFSVFFAHFFHITRFPQFSLVNYSFPLVYHSFSAG